MRMRIVLLAIALLNASGLRAAPEGENPASWFAQGNAKYQSGDFPGAEELYRRLVDSGVESGAVYYNLGNACFKQKKIGPAIYFWEKALARMPRDQDVKANLELADLFVVDRIEVPPDPVTIRWILVAVHFFTLEQESWIVVALFILTNAMVAVYIVAGRSGTALKALVAAGICALLLACSLASFAWKLYESAYIRRGVVVAEKVDIRSGPGTHNVTVFTVHEGVRLRIHNTVGGWYQVSLPNGWSGWLPSDSVWPLTGSDASKPIDRSK
ncbi:MAG: tetratricopeptide repeat protein [Acidobacteria bacterium]|nr:tetratricopeptide repeat protein [Acidobacteriota bacterium]